jgi:hypothetical protein
MKVINLQVEQNSINDLPDLSHMRYENIFNVNLYNNYYFYNIIKTIKFPENINPELYYEKIINSKKPYTTISYEIYGTQDLWWFILLSNNISNPVSVCTPGTKLKVIKMKYLKDILESIKSANNV